MKSTDIKIGDKVIYIPNHLLVGNNKEMIKEENLGIVTSMNDHYVFVRYKNKSNSEATKPSDLFSLKDRPDLAKLL